MNPGRCVGLVGGLGVGAAVHYYTKLAEAHEREGVGLDLVMVNAEPGQVLAYIEAGDRAGLATYLNNFLRRLKAAGAQFGVIPAVTPHYCFDELAPVAELPLISIFEPLRREVILRRWRRIALFGTRYVMESRLFGMLPEVEMIQPRPDEMTYIHETYTALARHGRGGDAEHAELTKLARMLAEREAVDAIVFAGTDLVRLFNESNTHFPHIDCAALHIDAVLGESLVQPR